MRLPSYRIPLRVILAATLIAGCGGGGGDRPADGDTSSADVATATDTAARAVVPAASGAGSAGAGLAPDDIDRWQRGMVAELAAVREAAAALTSARTGADSVAAISAANDMAIRDAGAAGAGVDPNRYQLIRNTLSPVVSQMTPIEMEMDVSKMPRAIVDQMNKARADGLAQATGALPPDLVAALRPRAAALRAQELALAGERLRAAGLGR